MTGVVLDQMQEFCPIVIDIYKRLADTGCCEFIGETYYHSSVSSTRGRSSPSR